MALSTATSIPTTSPLSLSFSTSLPLRSVNSGRGQLCNSSSPALAASTASFESATYSTGTLPTLPKRTIQFAGDTMEDWLLAESLLSTEIETLPTSAEGKKHIAFLPLPASHNEAGALKRKLRSASRAPRAPEAEQHIAFSLPTTHDSAGALKRHTRCASPAPAPRASEAPQQIAFSLPTAHNVAGALKRKTRRASPAPRAQHIAFSPQEAEHNIFRAMKRKQRSVSPAPAARAPLLSLSLPSPSNLASRLHQYRQEIQSRRFEKLLCKPASSSLNEKPVKCWVAEQRALGSRMEDAWVMADLAL